MADNVKKAKQICITPYRDALGRFAKADLDSQQEKTAKLERLKTQKRLRRRAGGGRRGNTGK